MQITAGRHDPLDQVIERKTKMLVVDQFLFHLYHHLQNILLFLFFLRTLH